MQPEEPSSTSSSSAPASAGSTRCTTSASSASPCAVLEMGDGVGGTWYWNRYPGARCDVPSLEYSYGFSKELQHEWEWTEIMPAREEIEEYLQPRRRPVRPPPRHPARYPRHRGHVRRGRRARWLVETDTGERFLAQFVVMATGCLSAPMLPDDSRGATRSRARCPDQPVAAGRRRLHRTPRRADRHRFVGRAGHARDRAGGRAPLRVPAQRRVLLPRVPRA